MTWPFEGLERGKYGAILADPPWAFNIYGWTGNSPGVAVPQRAADEHYRVMDEAALSALPVGELAADDCVLFVWVTWPTIEWALRVVDKWGFKYKTCAFSWLKANAQQIDMFRDDADVAMGLGYWTRTNSEVCLLATRGKPTRLNADVRQGIIEPRREHSRKPDCVHDRIKRLVAGPYLELFARTRRPGWDAWGNETGKFVPPSIGAPPPDFDPHAPIEDLSAHFAEANRLKIAKP
jgi:N6-adenosine-specific RNA methylase IME4